MKRSLLCKGSMLFFALVHAGFVARAQPAAADRIDFNRDIRPILSHVCFTCHGPDASKRQANLRLDRRETAFALRDGKPALVPAQPSKSEVYRRITSTDPDHRMPPADSGRTLNKAQIELIRKWIEQGAQWQRHWSFIAPQRSPLPQVKDASWPRNAIDYFILLRLENAGLKPSPQAGKRTLIRRLSLDLMGLPPTRQEVDAFLADESPDAYEKLVDRLLASPRYGERMALNWLDAARYADTHGYHEDYHRDMWPWRDWVINAFNSNMPFDQFTIEQLAGDLLPGATNSQIVATGFNRNHGVTASGISEEYRVEYVLDRVRTTSTVWLGLTMHCAQCHNHKYDPISQADFYQFFAYFNTITDKGVENRSGNVDPLLKVETPELAATLVKVKQQISKLKQEKQRQELAIGPDLAAWEQRLAAKDGGKKLEPPKDLVFHYPLDATTGDRVANEVGTHGQGKLKGNAIWRPGRFAEALSCDGKTYIDLGDTADFERTDAFSYGAWVLPTGSGAVIARMDDPAAYRGWDVFVTGMHVEAHMIHHWPDNAIHMKTKEKLKPDQWTHLFVTYDGLSKAGGFRIYFNGKPQAVDVTRDRLTDTIKTEKPLHIGRRNPSAFFQGAIDDVRIYDRALTGAEVATLADANPVAAILTIASELRTEKQKHALRQYYLENHDTKYRQLNVELDKFRTQETETRERAAKLTVMVMQEMKEPRTTFVLKRGQYDQHGEKVTTGVPAFLSVGRTASPSRDGLAIRPTDRLNLAKWLVSSTNPLTSRVAVNRMWQMAFGTGTVKTSEDFGTQGELPSHPELLDWLATEFIRGTDWQSVLQQAPLRRTDCQSVHSWDIKQMMKLIVTSATYRQSSKISPAAVARDPENRLLGRGPRFRLPAELIRDNALAVSGLMVEHLGGPSVKPYQPQGLWKETSNRGYEQDHGSKLYRRSLYTYWKRSVPPPNMFAIDAPTRETCVVRRQRTNTPLMALVMLNDPTFVEAARALAQRAMTEGAVNPQERIALMFEITTARRPEPSERDVLLAIYQRQRGVFGKNNDAALKLLAVGESKRDEKLDPTEHAALTTVASIILNLDETITKE